MRTWDSLFYEGPKILFRVALAMLKIYEDNMLRVGDAGELLMRMRNAAGAQRKARYAIATGLRMPPCRPPLATTRTVARPRCC